MSRPCEITVVDEKARHYPKAVPDAWKFAPTGRFQWVQRLAWRFLQWRIALKQHTETATKYIRVVLDTDDARKQVEQAIVVVWDITNEPPRAVYCGPELWRELLQSDGARRELIGPIEMPVKVSRAYPFPGGPPGMKPVATVHGINLYIVSWMKGILVLP